MTGQRESIWGIWADLGSGPSAEDIDEVRREVWAFLDDDSRFPFQEATATDVRFDEQFLHISLADGRIISLPTGQIPWLVWLAEATSEQRQDWHLEPGGFAIHWDALDNGIEVRHLLSIYSLV